MGTPPLGSMYGAIGELRVGPRRAATLRRWSFVFGNATLGPVTVHGTAGLETVDDFLIHQTPIDLWLWMGDAWWVWTGATVAGTFTSGSTLDIRVSGNPVVNHQHRPY